MIVTFCGHSRLYSYDDVEIWLNETVEKLAEEGADCFYLGGYGVFDHIAARIVHKTKERHPHIRSILVIPYPDRKYDTEDLYDETLYPELEKVPRRFAISKRNEYMVNCAEVVVAFVEYCGGGARKMLEYAERKHKRIIRYAKKD